MRRFRVAGLALLALAVPTFAFGGEEAPPGPANLSVSASLGGCGLANAAIVCQIDTSWSALEGADYYSVSVTRPDGSVLDLGQGAGAGRTLFVPYVGSGTYSVQVAAWGTPPGEEEPEVLARERVLSTDGAKGEARVASQPDRSGAADDGRTAENVVAGASDQEDVAADDPPVTEAPACEELTEAELDALVAQALEEDAGIDDPAPATEEPAAEDEANEPPTVCP